MHADFNALIGVAGNAEQLDGFAHFLCVADVARLNIRDALGKHIVKSHAGMKGDRSHDGNFASCVIAFDVSGRVSLRVAEFGSLCQRFGKLHAVLCHAREDIIGCAVDNAHDFCDAVASQALLERMDNGNRTGNRCLKLQIAVVFLGKVEQLAAVHRNQVFVCCHDIFVCL